MVTELETKIDDKTDDVKFDLDESTRKIRMAVYGIIKGSQF